MGSRPGLGLAELCDRRTGGSRETDADSSTGAEPPRASGGEPNDASLWGSGWRSEAGVPGLHDGFGSGGDVELGEDAGDVVADRAW